MPEVTPEMVAGLAMMMGPMARTTTEVWELLALAGMVALMMLQAQPTTEAEPTKRLLGMEMLLVGEAPLPQLLETLLRAIRAPQRLGTLQLQVRYAVHSCRNASGYAIPRRKGGSRCGSRQNRSVTFARRLCQFDVF